MGLISFFMSVSAFKYINSSFFERRLDFGGEPVCRKFTIRIGGESLTV